VSQSRLIEIFIAALREMSNAKLGPTELAEKCQII
jgi:hypothetical protein